MDAASRATLGTAARNAATMPSRLLRAGIFVAPLLPALSPSFQRADDPWPVTFVDVAEKAGLRQPSVYGGLEHKRFIIETHGGGEALVDFDNDGSVDALVLSGTRFRVRATL